MNKHDDDVIALAVHIQQLMTNCMPSDSSSGKIVSQSHANL